MPVAITAPAAKGELSTQLPSQKPTKAERRELQEKQRAAKAAKQVAAAGSSTQKPATTPVSKKATGKTPDVVLKTVPAKPSKDKKDTGSVGGAEDREQRMSRGLRIFSHFGEPKHLSVSSVKGNVHPAIIRLGLLFSGFTIVGANARCIATLTAFKTVIRDYSTPANNTLSRHLVSHISPQITHLVSARPMSVTMGNAIRQLKVEISGSDIDMPEQDAKTVLCRKIDNYIRDKIIFADQVIQDLAGKKIKDGDVILTFARSSVVEKVLLGAHDDGKDFSVIVVDSHPMLEGKRLLTALSSAGISCTYLLLSAIASVITEVSTVIVGAHSIHSNGAVFSRAGTALVAMMAKQHSVPVLVCCETYKFSEGLQLDSFTRNELVPQASILTSSALSRTQQSSTYTSTVEILNPLPYTAAGVADRSRSLNTNPNLEILNPLYDLTPPSYITAVVTEVGLVPPSSISSISMALGRPTL